MPRRPEGTIPLIRLDPSLRAPLQRQLADAVRAAIRDGRLAAGSRLPSTRSLADDLDLSRSTVVAAFEQLCAEGVLESRRGSGTRVAEAVASWAGSSDPVGADPADPAGETGLRMARISTPPPPFQPGIPAVDEVDSGHFARSVRRVLRVTSGAHLTLGDPAGDPGLRIAISRHLRTTRQVRCSAEDILVTSGAQESLALAIAALTEPGAPVWMEHPGYIGARRAIETAGADPRGVPVDEDGMRVEDGPIGAHGPHTPKAVYLTPSHQFPTGVPLSLARRMALLDWADAREGWIIEDDYDSEFRLEGRPLPSMQGLRDRARVLYVGTFAKSLAPGIRLGFLVAPPELRPALLEMKVARSGPGPRWMQAALLDFMEEGHFARHIRRTRALYRERRDTLVAALAAEGSGSPRLRQPTGAMHAVLDLPRHDPKAIADAARAEGIHTIPLDYFAVPGAAPVDPALVLGFAGWSPDRLRASAARLLEVIGKVGPRRHVVQ